MLHSQSDVRCDPPRRERQSTRFKGCSPREVRLRPRSCRFICQSGSRDTGHGLFGEFDLSSTSTPRPLRDALTPEIGCWRPARRRTAQLSAWTSRRRRRSGGEGVRRRGAVPLHAIPGQGKVARRLGPGEEKVEDGGGVEWARVETPGAADEAGVRLVGAASWLLLASLAARWVGGCAAGLRRQESAVAVVVRGCVWCPLADTGVRTSSRPAGGMGRARARAGGQRRQRKCSWTSPTREVGDGRVIWAAAVTYTAMALRQRELFLIEKKVLARMSPVVTLCAFLRSGPAGLTSPERAGDKIAHSSSNRFRPQAGSPVTLLPPQSTDRPKLARPARDGRLPTSLAANTTTRPAPNRIGPWRASGAPACPRTLGGIMAGARWELEL